MHGGQCSYTSEIRYMEKKTSVCDIGNMVGKAKMNVGGICSGFSLSILLLFPIIIDLCDKCQLYVS